jgi:hypothetical protein
MAGVGSPIDFDLNTRYSRKFRSAYLGSARQMVRGIRDGKLPSIPKSCLRYSFGPHPVQTTQCVSKTIDYLANSPNSGRNLQFRLKARLTACCVPQIQYIVQIHFVVIMTCAKLSALCTYLRVAKGTKYRRFVWATIIFITLWGICEIGL